VPYLTESPPSRFTPGISENHSQLRQPLPRSVPAVRAPSFYITGHQPLRPAAVPLAIVIAVGALCTVLFALNHSGRAHFSSGGSGADPSARGMSGPSSAAAQKGDDDPNQVDTIVLGDPDDAPTPAQSGDHVNSVHPTIVVHLPRSGEQVGFIPNSPAGHLLYNWLAGFNQASYPGIANSLPTFALASATAAQMELRQQTGGFNLLSAKEVQPGILVFRLRDQSPSATEALGTLRVRPNSNPATIASFSLRAVPSPSRNSGTAPK
jgi:hypothetical protein